MKNLVEEEKIEDTINRIPQTSFTVLDFIQVFKTLHPEEWHQLVERFGTFGEKRRYTTTTYLSNRLDVYSQKSNSLLIPFARWKQARFKDYRRTTEEEKKFFGSPCIAVFKKREASKTDG
jgi:hypothetical protein